MSAPTRSPIRLAILTALSLALGGCSWLQAPPQARGNRVEDEQLRQLVPGTSTKADVTTLIGSPTQRATFDDNTWLYISETTRTRVGRVPGILDQSVVVLTFDDRGVLAGVKSVSKDDGIPVAIAERITPSPGTEASFMQQLLGNIGRFTPAGVAGGGGTPSGIRSGP